jgi:hypothetical protein
MMRDPMMRNPTLKSILVAAALTVMAALLPQAPALASRVPPNMLSGSVTGVSGNQIIVDGKSYSVRTDSPALRQLQQLQVGQKVDLVLNGPPSSAASQVVAVSVHPAGT